MIPKNHIEIAPGQKVVIINKLKNGLIEIEPTTSGTIVYNPNQTRATVWVHSTLSVDNTIRDAFQTEDKWFNADVRPSGLSVSVKREHFAHLYQYDFDDMKIDKRLMENVPLFNGEGLKEVDMRWFNGDAPYKGYLLWDVRNRVDDLFYEWVMEELETRKITQDEIDNEEYPEGWEFVYTQDSMDKYWIMKETLEIAFAKATNVYVEFIGGMNFE